MPQRREDHASSLFIAEEARALAAEARAQAAQTKDPQIRSAKLSIAESYEHLAAFAERAAGVTKPKL